MDSIDIEKICRTCLGLSGPLLSLYDGGGRGTDCLADMLRDFTKTKPKRSDNMPEKVCLNCISEINRCYSFKIKCENSSRTLRQLLVDALPEEEEEERVLSSGKIDKSIQTTKAVTLDIETQTVTKEKFITGVQTQEKATSPLLFADTNDSNSKQLICKSLKIDKDTKMTEVQFIENEGKHHRLSRSTTGSKVKPALKRKHNQMVKEEHDREIIFELEDDEYEAPLDVEQTVFEEEGHENTSYYGLSSSHDYEDNEEMQGEARQTVANIVTYTEEEDDEENKCTQIIYSEDTAVNDGVGVEQQQYFNYTIYNNEEENIISKPARKKAAAETSDLTHKIEFKCSSCVMTFVSKKNLKRHMCKRHGLSQAEAEEESTTALPKKVQSGSLKKFNDKNGIEMKVINNEKSMVGKTVDDSSLSEMTPQPIVTETTPAKLTFFCNRCNAGFAVRKSLIYHKKLNVCTAETYVCNECERVFISEENLNEHIATHILGHICSECNKVYESKEDLGEHMVEEHRRNFRNQCNVCKKVFTMFSALKDHMRVHSGEKPFLCPFCGKAFTQNTNLKQHVMRHSNEKKFRCDQCSNSYVTKAELFSHQRTHTGDQPFECEYCSANFTTSSSLIKHRRKHTGERPYACDICPMRFMALNVLKNHRRTHTGEKPYKCFYCEKGFTQKGDCQIHQRTHTGESKGGVKKRKVSSKTSPNLSQETPTEKIREFEITILNVDENDESTEPVAENEKDQEGHHSNNGEELIQMAIEDM